MRLLRDDMPRHAIALCSLAVILALSGCDTGSPSPPPPGHVSRATSTNTLGVGALRVGDRVVVEFQTGNSEVIPSVPQEIAADGSIKLPFVGNILAVGKTPAQLQNDIQEAYIPKYYQHLNVTVTMPTRFFSVGGFVNKGDRFPYTA